MPAAPHRPRRHLKPFVPVASPAPQVVQRPLSSPSLPETSESENEIFEPSIPVSHPPPSIPTPTVLPVVQPVFVQNKVETKPVDEKRICHIFSEICIVIYLNNSYEYNFSTS